MAMRFQLAKLRVTSLKWVVGDNAVVAVEIDVMPPLGQILDLFAKDDQFNVYAGELEVRPR
jgi:hypothetical protein